MSILDWPDGERPREKLLERGAGALTEAELLAILLRTGVRGQSALDLARNLLIEFGSLRGLLSAPRERLCRTRGLGPAGDLPDRRRDEIAEHHRGGTLIRQQNQEGLEARIAAAMLNRSFAPVCADEPA